MQPDGKTTVKNSTTYSNLKKENNDGEGVTSVKFLNKEKLKRKASEILDQSNESLNMNKFKDANQTELVERCKKLNKSEH